MKKIITYLYLLVGVIESAQLSSKFTCYFQAVSEVQKVMEKSENLQNYAEADIKYIEEQMDNISDLNFKLLTGLLIADYYIHKEYKGDLVVVNPSDGIKKAADYIADFMIEYMDYERINEYIQPIKGYNKKFGDFLKEKRASVVLKDIEKAIIEYLKDEDKDKENSLSPNLVLGNQGVENGQTLSKQKRQVKQARGLKRKAGKSKNIQSNTKNKSLEREENPSKKTNWCEWFYSWFE